MLAGIPQKRLMLYLLVLGLIPIVLAAMSSSSTKTAARAAASRVQLLHEKAILADTREASNKAVVELYRNADHHYIDKYIESIPLLQAEIQGLEALLSGDEVAVDERLSTRLKHLKEDNRLVFTEGNVVSYPSFQETLETLGHAVEVNGDDIAAILSRVEGTSVGDYEAGPGRPQLIITKFHLERKGDAKSGATSEVFVLNMQVLKREYS